MKLDVTQLTNKGVAMDNEGLVNKEKLKGNFKININQNLPKNKKIQRYANEPVAFHLHKTRNFFERLEGVTEATAGAMEKMEEMREKIDESNA
jgi:translation elongation factor EF-1beta